MDVYRANYSSMNFNYFFLVNILLHIKHHCLLNAITANKFFSNCFNFSRFDLKKQSSLVTDFTDEINAHIHFYLAMLNIPQICFKYAINIVPVATIAVIPMHIAAFVWNKIK